MEQKAAPVEETKPSVVDREVPAALHKNRSCPVHTKLQALPKGSLASESLVSFLAGLTQMLH